MSIPFTAATAAYNSASKLIGQGLKPAADPASDGVARP